MAQLQDIGPVYRGEDVIMTFTMTPLTDISGWTISFRVKQTATDAATLMTISATLATPTSGIFSVAMGAAQSLTLPRGTYEYDVWRTDGGSAAALALGKLQVNGTVKNP